MTGTDMALIAATLPLLVVLVVTAVGLALECRAIELSERMVKKVRDENVDNE